jgi:hypothetical protein
VGSGIIKFLTHKQFIIVKIESRKSKDYFEILFEAKIEKQY